MPHRVTVELEADHFVIHAGHPRGGDDVHRAITAWPGWRRSPLPGGDVSRFTAPCYASVVLGMQNGVCEVVWSPEARARREALLERLRSAQDTLSHRAGLQAKRKQATARTPMPHQLQALRAVEAMDYCALLADDMGLGKSATAAWAADDSGANSVLVVCPVSVKRNWIRELELALGDGWRTLLIDGTRPKRASQFADLRSALQSSEGSIAAVINHDLLIHLTDDQFQQLVELVSDGFLIVDEAHAFKNRRAERTKAISKLAQAAPRRLLLTGTPVLNTVEDLYSLVQLIRPGTWTSYQDFANRHLVIRPVDFGKKTVQKVVGSKNKEALNQVVNTLQIRRKKEDVLDLPPKTYTMPELELDGSTRAIYKAMKEFAVIKLGELSAKTSVFDPRAKSAVEAAMRCEQIASGFIGGIPEPVMDRISDKVLRGAEKIKGRPNELMFPRAPKVMWLLETIEALWTQGNAPVVFSRFNAPMQWLRDHYVAEGFHVSWLHGGLTPREKTAQIDDFQENRTDLFLCQVTMAEGFNLVRSQDVIFYTRDWSPARNRQAEDRCHRIGQKGTVNVQIPLVRKTIETAIERKLQAKANDAEDALRRLTVADLEEAL